MAREKILPGAPQQAPTFRLRGTVVLLLLCALLFAYAAPDLLAWWRGAAPVMVVGA